MPTEYRVLEEGVTRELFAEVATRLGLARANVFEPEGEKGYEEVWANPGRTGAVNYIEDAFLGLTYAMVRGSDAEALVTGLTHNLALYWPEELIETALSEDADHNERVATLYRLAVTFPDHDDEVHDIFERYATAAPHPLLRTAALDAIGLHAWEELRPVVEKVAQDDPEAEVREHAKAVLARWIAARGE